MSAFAFVVSNSILIEKPKKNGFNVWNVKVWARKACTGSERSYVCYNCLTE